MDDLPPGIPEDVLAWMRERVRERGPVPMTDQIFRHGRAYHECALRCLELRGEGQTLLFLPSLVLLAFVVEIYLKGLLDVEGKAARGHDHAQLFMQLDSAKQERIAARYAERHQGQKLADDLPAYSKLFVEVRYSYELDGEHAHDISGVAQLASTLYETWTALRPDLVQVGIVHDRITAGKQGVPIITIS
jgi:hypothetical protein